MKISKRQLKRIIKEEYLKVISEGMSAEEVTGIPEKPRSNNPRLPWFINEFINDLGVHLDNTEAQDRKNIDKFKVEFFGGGRTAGYVFTKIRVVFTVSEPQWDGYRTHQMVYSLPYRGYLPSKATKSQKKIQISKDLLEQYKAACDAAGIQVLNYMEAKKYRKAPYALDSY